MKFFSIRMGVRILIEQVAQVFASRDQVQFIKPLWQVPKKHSKNSLPKNKAVPQKRSDSRRRQPHGQLAVIRNEMRNAKLLKSARGRNGSR